MAQHSGVFCLLSLSIILMLVDNAFASPLMSVHGDAAGRRHRMSTSWAPSSFPTNSDETNIELFNPMVRSKTLKYPDRVRPFNFRNLESEDMNPMTSTAFSEANSYFPLFRGGNNEVLSVPNHMEEGPADIKGLKNFVDGLKSRLRDEISLLLSITKAEEEVLHEQEDERKPETDGKIKKIFGMRALLHPSASFGKRRFVPSQLV